MEKSHSEKQIGRGMLYAAWIIALGLLTLYFTRWQEKQHNPNGQVDGLSRSGTNEVQLERNRFHHYVASGFINGVAVVFLVDTGATHVAIPAHIAKKIGLTKGMEGYAVTANGTVQTFATMIDTLQLGTIELREVRASINPGMEQDEILLGMSALKDVEFSSRNGILTLKQHPQTR